MLVNEQTLGGKIRRGFGAAALKNLWSDAVVAAAYPVTFANPGAYDDAMNAPNSKSGSAGQNNGTALTPISGVDLSNLTQLMLQANGTMDTTGNLVAAAKACQSALKNDCATMDQYQQSDQTVLGADNGRSTKQNTSYRAALTNLSSDLKTWIGKLTTAAALDAQADAVFNAPLPLPPGMGHQVVPLGPAATPTPVYAPLKFKIRTPAAVATPPQPVSHAAIADTIMSIVPPTNYTPYIIGFAVILVGVGYLYLKAV